MNTPAACKAKNPALCPYHGSKFYSKERLLKALTQLDSKAEFTFKEEGILDKKKYLKEAAVLRESLSDNEESSIYFYTYQSHRVVNLWLEDEKHWVPDGWPELEQGIVQDLDAVISRHGKHQEEKTLYRGVGNPEVVKGLRKGSTFSMKSFMSTTSDPMWVTNFVDDKNPVILKIRTRNGAPVSRNFPMEYEYLLGRDSTFKVTSIKKKVQWILEGSDFTRKHSKQNVTVIELADIS